MPAKRASCVGEEAMTIKEGHPITTPTGRWVGIEPCDELLFPHDLATHEGEVRADGHSNEDALFGKCPELSRDEELPCARRRRPASGIGRLHLALAHHHSAEVAAPVVATVLVQG